MDDNNNKFDNPDPIALRKLSTVVERLIELKTECETDKELHRFCLLLSGLENAFAETSEKYEMLKDRYTLLKQSNAALSNELVWLRDQIDDLSSQG